MALKMNFGAQRSGAITGQSLRVPKVVLPRTAAMPVVEAKKKWEKTPLNKNGKVARHKMNVRTGDTVKVVSGDDKGEISEVVRSYPKSGMIIVKGVNLKVKHVKPQRGEAGMIKRSEYPIPQCKVMHYSKAQETTSRLGKKIGADGKKVRYLIKTGEELP